MGGKQTYSGGINSERIIFIKQFISDDSIIFQINVFCWNCRHIGTWRCLLRQTCLIQWLESVKKNIWDEIAENAKLIYAYKWLLQFSVDELWLYTLYCQLHSLFKDTTYARILFLTDLLFSPNVICSHQQLDLAVDIGSIYIQDILF